MFKFFKRQRDFTAATFAEALRPLLGDLRVLIVSDIEIVIEDNGGLLADVVIGKDEKQFAFVTLIADIQPNLAADIALTVNEILPVFVDSEFMYTAEQLVSPNGALN